MGPGRPGPARPFDSSNDNLLFLFDYIKNTNRATHGRRTSYLLQNNLENGEQSSADNYLQEFTELLQSQPKKLYSQSWRRRQIQRVPAQIRRSSQVYDPVVISLGPYHHGKPELRRAEEFKHICLDRCAGGDEARKAFFYSKILEQVSAIIDSYSETTIVAKYDDKWLALMMLLDASIIVDYIRNFFGMLDWQRCLGIGSGSLMARDIHLMENQIPFRVLKLLVSLIYEEAEEEAELFLPRFITWISGYKIGIELKHAMIPQEKENPPLHFLEALWRCRVQSTSLLTSGNEHNHVISIIGEDKFITDINISHTLRSVMDLKAKGVRVRPYSTRSVKDIAFTPNVCFSQLHLPVLYVSDLSHVIWSNMIAFELSPNSTGSSLVVLSYAIFMKSLMQSPGDVKELQERWVLVNRLANLEKAVQVFKEIDTFGFHGQDVFKDVKRMIEEHCNNRAKTWISELVYTRFQTPWTAMALFAAVLLLCLSFLQTLFTIRR